MEELPIILWANIIKNSWKKKKKNLKKCNLQSSSKRIQLILIMIIQNLLRILLKLIIHIWNNHW